MTNFTPLSALLGGALIGLSASLLLLANGRVAGISGILGGLVAHAGKDRLWRGAFLAGLLLAGLAFVLLRPSAFGAGSASVPVLAAAGLLVGVGTRLGSGCTSGHGVCGLSRLSPRSLAATVTFMVTGGLTVFVTHHVLGVSP
jgi:uncharacterized membrane protein YedE/YeeE